MNTDAESTAGVLVNHSSKTDQSVAPAKKSSVGAAPKAARATKTTKVPQRPLRSSRAGSKAEELVCRYCGSDDLVPSFKNDATPDAAHASRSATVQLRRAENGRQSEDEGRQVVLIEGLNRIGSGLTC